MPVFADFVAAIENPQHRARTAEVLAWVHKTYPALERRIAWNQPMFTDHGTFIIGFSVAKHHLAVAPEKAGIDHFSGDIVQAGYERSQQLVRIKWEDAVDFSLLKKMIEFNIADKAETTSFWRKA